MQLLWQLTAAMPHSIFQIAFHILHSTNYRENGGLKLFYEKVIPYVALVCQAKQIPNQKALIIMDNFATAHSSGDAMQSLEDNGV